MIYSVSIYGWVPGRDSQVKQQVLDRYDNIRFENTDVFMVKYLNIVQVMLIWSETNSSFRNKNSTITNGRGHFKHKLMPSIVRIPSF